MFFHRLFLFNLHVEKHARMTNWFKYPFIRLLMPFALGIWLAFIFLPTPLSVI